MKIIFMGTPEFAVPVLQGLIDNYEVSLVVTQPDKKVGRKNELTYSPIKKLALANKIKVFQPIKIREDYESIITEKPDIIITCAYGQIIPEELINYPRLGCINVHASLLPKLRGGAPLHHAIIDGEKTTGITIMYMDKNMDTGDIISTCSYDIKDTDTIGSLHDILKIMGRDLLLKTLPLIINKTNKRIPQDSSQATYAFNIKREEEKIDFHKTCEEVDRLVRGLNPHPYANFILNGIEYKIISGYYKHDKDVIPGRININKNSLGIECSNGTYYIDRLKPAGKKEMDIKSYLNGIDINLLKNITIKN